MSFSMMFLSVSYLLQERDCLLLFSNVDLAIAFGSQTYFDDCPFGDKNIILLVNSSSSKGTKMTISVFTIHIKSNKIYQFFLHSSIMLPECFYIKFLASSVCKYGTCFDFQGKKYTR